MKRFKAETKERLLLETIEHFHRGNRSSDEKIGCQYLDKKTGNRCAIGMCLTKKELGVWKDWLGAVSDFTEEIPERLGKLGTDFLDEIQYLHDRENLWNEKGLNEKGEMAAKRIIENNNLDISDERLEEAINKPR